MEKQRSAIYISSALREREKRCEVFWRLFVCVCVCVCVCVIAAPEISFYHIIERQDCVGLGSFICLGEMHNIEILAHTADTFFL